MFLVAAIAALAAAPTRGRAQDMDVPVAVQIPVFLKVAAYDRQLDTRGRTEVVIAIAFQGGNRASTRAREDALRALAGADVNGVRVRAVTIDLDREELRAALEARRPAILYVTPLRSFDVGTIAAAARTARVLTVTGVAEYVTRGLAIGVRLQAQRPRILVNLAAARLEGASLTAELLSLAEVL